MKLIYAWSDVLPQNAQQIAKHGNDEHGSKSVHMLTPQVGAH
jgi:hypothetical protein